jgi:riboflavin kinase/FMN adenylyltransferase
MKAVKSWTDLPDTVRNACVAIGNFDGVHIGHRHVLDQTRAKAQELGVPYGILTFEPHPREFFVPSALPFRLDTAGTKRQRLAACGLQTLFELPFDDELANTSAKDFAKMVLCKGFSFSHIFVGANYRFGKNREGCVSDLINFGRQFGFGVTISELLTHAGGTISSTRIRECLSEGRLDDVGDLLGRRYSIQGMAHISNEHSQQIATISQTGLHCPKSGVYAIFVYVLEGSKKGKHKTTASIVSEMRPNSHEVECKVYCHNLFDDLHSTPISVELIEYLNEIPDLERSQMERNQGFHSNPPRSLRPSARPCITG